MEEVKIISEDNNLLILNKPAGLLVHGTKVSKEKTLVDWLIAKYPKIRQVGDEPELRPGIVHRLDKNTSGVLIVAKNQKTFKFLKKQFQERTVKKTYLALVYGNIKEDKGLIDMPIGKSKKDFRKKAGERGARGTLREAITEYKVLKRFCKKYTLVEAYPQTGRTHQIRVHFKEKSHAIVCDSLYAPKRECPSGLARQFLHASSLQINTPDSLVMKFEAELPKDLKNTLANLENLC